MCRLLAKSTSSAISSVMVVWAVAIWGHGVRAEAQCVPQKVVSSDIEGGARFAGSVAIDGRRALIGAHRYGGLSGGAFTFLYDGLHWTQEQLLTTDDGLIGGEFGYAVSLHDNVAVISAPWNDEIVDQEGAAYVFRFDGSRWNFEQKLTAPDADVRDLFGYDVVTNGQRIVIGARGDDEHGDGAGAAYVFRFDGSSWVLEQKLFGSEEGQPLPSAFGFSVDMDEARIIVGAPWDDRQSFDDGMAYVYRLNGNQWVLEQALLPPMFSNTVAFEVQIDGTTAVVSGDNNTPSGEALVYNFNGTSWSLAKRLNPPDSGVGDFSNAMSLEGDHLVIGAYSSFNYKGTAYLFRRSGGAWLVDQRFDPFDVHDTLGAPPFFGQACGISGDLVVIGAPYEDTSQGGDSGVLYEFRLECGSECLGTERVARARCNTEGNVVVKLVGGRAGDVVQVTLDTGESVNSVLNGRGNKKVVISGVPQGPNRAAVAWGCGANRNEVLFCP